MPATFTSASMCGQYANIEYDTEGRHVSVLIKQRSMCAVHTPPQPKTLSKHPSNTKGRCRSRTHAPGDVLQNIWQPRGR